MQSKFLLIFVISLTLVLGANMRSAAADDLIKPESSMSPAEVISIQLNALKNNNSPEEDYGIAQTWEFAHPINRMMTGPLSQFTLMIKSPSYRHLLNHRSHDLQQIEMDESRALFAVTLISDDGQVLGHLWEVTKVNTGPFEDMWMTTRVSPPRPMGNAV